MIISNAANPNSVTARNRLMVDSARSRQVSYKPAAQPSAYERPTTTFKGHVTSISKAAYGSHMVMTQSREGHGNYTAKLDVTKTDLVALAFKSLEENVAFEFIFEDSLTASVGKILAII